MNWPSYSSLEVEHQRLQEFYRNLPRTKIVELENVHSLMTASNSMVESIEQEYDWDVVSPSVAVIHAIAHYEDTTAPKMAEQLDPPLRRAINLDALNNLITPQKELAISFTYADYHIQIHGNTVKIASPPSPTTAPQTWNQER